MYEIIFSIFQLIDIKMELNFLIYCLYVKHHTSVIFSFRQKIIHFRYYFVGTLHGTSILLIIV